MKHPSQQAMRLHTLKQTSAGERGAAHHADPGTITGPTASSFGMDSIWCMCTRDSSNPTESQECPTPPLLLPPTTVTEYKNKAERFHSRLDQAEDYLNLEIDLLKYQSESKREQNEVSLQDLWDIIK